MSELEYIKVLINGQPFDMYFKSDVDAVLAEKDKQLRHHKFKRCLAMAEWCNGEMGRETFACFRPRGTKELWREEHNYWAKWRKIWFELAQKFKESV